MDSVGYTCQITAGFRAVELSHVPDPIIVDHLAQHLAGEALQQALEDYHKLVEAQGPGLSLRVPARNRIIDDYVLDALQQLALHSADADIPVQVINIGCGMDTKPWRLRPPVRVHWFDVDQPSVMQLKRQLLHQAEAALELAEEGKAAMQQGRPKFPLLVDSWHPVSADLAVTTLNDCLEAASFRRDLPTIWIAEALLYYLPLLKACQLLSEMCALSSPGSKLVATCIDKELQEAHLRLDTQHYFSTANVAWHFCMGDLLSSCGSHGDGGGQDNSNGQEDGQSQSHLEKAGWRIIDKPVTSADLARQLYVKETYVALYGGAECCFTAAVRE